jgi:hypothetical protein
VCAAVAPLLQRQASDGPATGNAAAEEETKKKKWKKKTVEAEDNEELDKA